MNIKECIDTVDNLKPNQYTIKEKVMWLSFIEEIIINDVLKTHEGYDGRYDDFEGYSEDKISVTLIVPSPYDRLYTAYLTMKIDESNGETTRYNNSATLYNTYMMEYKKYYNKTHMPIDVIGGNRHMKPQHKPSVSLSDAEYDNIVKDLTFKLTEYFSNTISPDKLYDIVMKYVQNNVEMLKGKDGRDGVDGKNGHTPAVGVDYFTENDKMEFLNHLQEYISSLALSEGDVTTEMIDDGAVTTAKIDDEAVTTEKIRDGAVTRDKLAPDSVTGDKIKEGSVGSLHIIDKNITTKKLADGAVTGDKIDDGAVLPQHLSVEVVERINSNKFDGYIATIADADGIDNRDNPHNVRIFRVGKDNGKGEGGILIVSGDTNTLYEHHPLEAVEQTYITHDGCIRTRHATNWDGYDGLVFEWSEWKSRYLTSEDVQKEIEKTKIITSAEGATIAVLDSDDAKLRGLKVFGRTEQYTNGFQLFDVNNLIGGNLDNASLAINEDGSFTITNNTSQNAYFSYTKYIAVKNIFKVGKNLGLKVYGATNVEVTLGFSDLGDIGIDGTYISNRAGGQDSFEMTQSILDNAASLTVLMNGTLDGSSSETIKIMLYQDGDGTWEPFTGGIPAPTTEFPCKLVSVGNDGSVDVNVSGKNLLPYPYYIPYPNVNGVTVTDNGDGSLTVDGTATANAHFTLVATDGSWRMPAGEYILSSGLTNNSHGITYGLCIGYRPSLTDPRLVLGEIDGKLHISLAEDSFIDCVLTVRAGQTVSNLVVKPMLRLAEFTDDTWEPCKPIQTLTIPTPNGLPGVPVESGGNYTDASGQQWACDEVDFDRGVYVQRIYKYEVTGLEKWKQHSELTVGGYWRYDCSVETPINIGQNSKIDLCMCTHYKYKASMGSADEGVWVTNTTYGITPVVGLRIVSTLASLDELTQMLKDQHSAGTPITYQYILAEPIETPLSEDEINAYKALHTYKPNTSIHNSENAYMSVDYVADTKNYVDNQIKKEVAELTAAILTQ